MFDITEIVPHTGKMLLLDKVQDSGEDWIVAEVTINKNSMFCEDGSVPALVGIEYMAQTIAAFAGKNDKLNKRDPAIGLLLGCRKYESNVNHFKTGTKLIIHAQQIYFENNGLGVFQCKIESKQGEKILIKANINVFQPEDISNLISDN